MKRILPWLLLPLGMMAFVFLAECVVNGVDLNVEREGDTVRVFTTNRLHQCSHLQFNRTLDSNTWFGYYRFIAEAGEPSEGFSFKVKADEQKVFWRLRDCANP